MSLVTNMYKIIFSYFDDCRSFQAFDSLSCETYDYERPQQRQKMACDSCCLK